VRVIARDFIEENRSSSKYFIDSFVRRLQSKGSKWAKGLQTHYPSLKLSLWILLPSFNHCRSSSFIRFDVRQGE
jgi:hypothetical protein